MYDDLAAAVHSMAVVAVEVLANGYELVIEDHAYVMMDGDSAGGKDDDGIADAAGYSHAETTSDGVGVVQNHAPEVHESDQMVGFENNFHDLNVYHMVREADDCTENGDANRIYASRGMEVAHHHPKS